MPNPGRSWIPDHFFRSRISPKALESSLVSLQSDSLNNNLALREKGAPPKMPVTPANRGPPVSWGKFPGLGQAGQSLAGLRAASSEDQQCHLVGEFSKLLTSGRRREATLTATL